MTDAKGNYAFDNAINGNVVTASKPGFSFSPQSAKCVSTNGSCGNFTQNFTVTYAISGRVIDGNGNDIGDVVLQLTSSNSSISRTLQTDAGGTFSFASLLAGGTYTVTPSKSGYVFSPFALRFSSLNTDQSNIIFTGTMHPYTISGKVADARITSPAINGLSGVRITLRRVGAPTSEPVFVSTTDGFGTYGFTNVAAEGTYTVTASKVGFSFTPSSYTFSSPNGNQTADFVALTTSSSTIQFAAPQFNVIESNELAAITVTRVGDTSATAIINFATSDGTAHQRSDYTLASGTLSFAAGEVSKTFTVLITDNAYVDGSRTVNLSLSNPFGATLGSPSTAVLTITDNDTVQPTTNPIDGTSFFVRQQYADFLNRAPDDGGLAYWSSLITTCSSTDQVCINSKRVSVSAAFFIEQEFQLTGNYVYRMYKAAYGQRPTYAQFLPDRARINPAADQIEASKQQFANLFVQRAEFLAKYPASMTPDAFIDGLIATVKTETNGAVDLTSQRATLLTALQQSGRASVVRQVAENAAFQSAEYNKAFVTMQYFGYLRRDPEDGGYNFWLDVLNNKVANNYRGMVCAFITSAEYQNRFSPIFTRNDSVCGSIGQ